MSFQRTLLVPPTEMAQKAYRSSINKYFSFCSTSHYICGLYLEMSHKHHMKQDFIRLLLNLVQHRKHQVHKTDKSLLSLLQLG